MVLRDPCTFGIISKIFFCFGFILNLYSIHSGFIKNRGNVTVKHKRNYSIYVDLIRYKIGPTDCFIYYGNIIFSNPNASHLENTKSEYQVAISRIMLVPLAFEKIVVLRRNYRSRKDWVRDR